MTAGRCCGDIDQLCVRDVEQVVEQHVGRPFIGRLADEIEVLVVPLDQ